MKSRFIFKFFFIFLFFNFNLLFSQEIIEYNFTRMSYFAPASEYTKSSTQTSRVYSKVDINQSENLILISVFYDDETIKSKYKIEKVIDKGDYYSFQCLAENYSTSIIDIQKSGVWVKRIVKHNGIIHKFFNNP